MRDSSAADRPRSANKFPVIFARTNRFENLLIFYTFANYQWLRLVFYCVIVYCIVSKFSCNRKIYRNFIDRMLFRQAYSVSVWLLSWLFFIHLTAVPVSFLLYATVFFIFLHIYLQLRFVFCILYNKWMKLSQTSTLLSVKVGGIMWCLFCHSYIYRTFIVIQP